MTNEEMQTELKNADIEATSLLVAMMMRVDKPSGWEPLPTVAGKISQINNLVAGMREEIEGLREEIKGLNGYDGVAEKAYREGYVAGGDAYK